MERFRKLSLVLLAIIMVFGNVDVIMAFLIGISPEGVPRHIQLIFVIAIANIEAVIWYHLGVKLVPILARFYVILNRRHRALILSGVVDSLSYALSLIFKGFYYWDDTKAKLDKKIQIALNSWYWIILTFFVWLIVPGGRASTAILFGMDRWKWGLAVLLLANTVHVTIWFFFFSQARESIKVLLDW